MFGLQQYSRRYSTPSSLRGAKLSLNEMNRTHSLKLRKIKDIQTARIHLPDYQGRGTYRLIGEDQHDSNSLFFSHSKVLKRDTTPKLRQTHRSSENKLVVESTRPKAKQEQQLEEEKEKVYFYSANLDQTMNLYMNRMLNRSEHERKEKMRQIEEKINLTYLDKINSTKTQNQFWRKMRRSISKKSKQQPQGNSSNSTNQAMWEELMRK